MSHDRGCMRCGDYRLDYSDCKEKDCPKRSFVHSVEMTGRAKESTLNEPVGKQALKEMCEQGAIPASYVHKRIFQRLVRVLERARVRYYNPSLSVDGDYIIFKFKRNK